MKRIFAMLVALLLSFSALNYSQAHARRNPAAVAPSAQSRAARLRFVPRYIRGANRQRRYRINARYPQAVGANDERTQRLNQVIRDLMTREVEEFKRDAGPAEGGMTGVGSTFESTYKVSLNENDLVSIGFFISAYYEGAVHGVDKTFVLNYDLNSGKVLKLADLFQPDSKYLDLLSAYSIRAIKKELGADGDSEWIEKGAGAEEANYRNWNITRKGLEIFFERYQVTPWVMPPPDIVIPYGDLRSAINPAGPLAKIAGMR